MPKFTLQKSPYKIYGSRCVQKIHHKMWHHIPCTHYWFHAIINDYLKMSGCFLGNFEALSSNRKSFWHQKAPITIFLGYTKTMSSTGGLQIGMDARLEELHFEPSNCEKDLADRCE